MLTAFQVADVSHICAPSALMQPVRDVGFRDVARGLRLPSADRCPNSVALDALRSMGGDVTGMSTPVSTRRTRGRYCVTPMPVCCVDAPHDCRGQHLQGGPGNIAPAGEDLHSHRRGRLDQPGYQAARSRSTGCSDGIGGREWPAEPCTTRRRMRPSMSSSRWGTLHHDREEEPGATTVLLDGKEVLSVGLVNGTWELIYEHGRYYSGRHRRRRVRLPRAGEIGVARVSMASGRRSTAAYHLPKTLLAADRERL